MTTIRCPKCKKAIAVYLDDDSVRVAHPEINAVVRKTPEGLPIAICIPCAAKVVVKESK